MRRDLPTGTVTFLFTDVEGSTRLLLDLGAEAYSDALAEQRRIVREAFLAQGGVEVDAQRRRPCLRPLRCRPGSPLVRSACAWASTPERPV
jgi:class 3 adenylate cyclase